MSERTTDRLTERWLIEGVDERLDERPDRTKLDVALGNTVDAECIRHSPGARFTCLPFGFSSQKVDSCHAEPAGVIEHSISWLVDKQTPTLIGDLVFQ